MLKKISIAIGLLLFSSNVYLKGLYSGYLEGTNLCGIRYPYNHLNPFYELNAPLFYVSLFLIFFIIGNLTKNEILSQITAIASIVMSFLLFHQIYSIKSEYVIESYQYVNLIRETIWLDKVHVWICLALLIYQIFTAFYYWFLIKGKAIANSELK